MTKRSPWQPSWSRRSERDRLLSPARTTVNGMEFTTQEARRYVASVRWQCAHTMPQWPHEYTLRRWRQELAEEFDALVTLIRAEGVAKPWPKAAAVPRYHHRYLEIDGWQYWTMGEPVEETTLINRCRVGGPAAA